MAKQSPSTQNNILTSKDIREAKLYLGSVFDVPKNIKTIDHMAFQGSLVNKIILNDGLKNINKWAFYGCEHIHEINIPDSVELIEEGAFEQCRNLKRVRLPNALKKIPTSIFRDCAIESIDLPETVESIGTMAFTGTKIEKIDLRDVTVLGSYSFSSCRKLREVILPADMEELPVSIFENCDSLEKITLPKNLKIIGTGAFSFCNKFENITIPNTVTQINRFAFSGCKNLKKVFIPESVTQLHEETFSRCASLTHVSLKGVKKLEVTSFEQCPNLDTIELNPNVQLYYEYQPISSKLSLKEKEDYIKTLSKLQPQGFYGNLLNNLATAIHKKTTGSAKYIPATCVLGYFPKQCFEHYYMNGNDKRWKSIIKTFKYDVLYNKDICAPDLFKLYYCLGGFSKNEDESERAKKFLTKTLLPSLIEKYETYDEESLSQVIHEKYCGLKIEDEYCPVFAKFVMKNFTSVNFLSFELDGREYRDYFVSAHNHFKELLEAYPHRLVEGNEQRSLLTPLFVAENCMKKRYNNVTDETRLLADLAGTYGYSQSDFDHMKEIIKYVKEKKIQNNITAQKDDPANPITFAILDKTDEDGFFLGDITNCCQKLSGVARTTVEDGFLNPDACFIAFLKSDKVVKKSSRKHILGQAYTWYDREKGTVCLDNVEIPTAVKKQLEQGEKHGSEPCYTSLKNAIERSADAIMADMNKNGVQVKKVTMGEGFNDMKNQFIEYCKLTRNLAQHTAQFVLSHGEVKEVTGYSDATEGQYLIKEKKKF